MRILFIIPTILSICIIAGCTHNAALIKPVNEFIEYKNITYGADSPQQAMDVLLPEGRTAENTPVIILLHGGGWVQGDKIEFSVLGIDSFFAFRGFAVVNMNYRLDGSYKYPAPVDDIGTVMNMIQQKATEWQINGSKVCIMGKSSGSQLALIYAYTRNSDKRIKAIVDFYGPADLTDSTVTAKPFSMLVANLLGTYTSNMQAWHDASPAYFTKDAVPTFIFQGTADSLVYFSQAELLQDSLNVHSIPCNLVKMEGLGHGWPQDYWVQYRESICTWLTPYLH